MNKPFVVVVVDGVPCKADVHHKQEHDSSKSAAVILVCSSEEGIVPPWNPHRNYCPSREVIVNAACGLVHILVYDDKKQQHWSVEKPGPL